MTRVIPLLVVGLPLFVLALVVAWALPLAIFGYVTANGPDSWSPLLATRCLVSSFGAVWFGCTRLSQLFARGAGA